MPPVSSVAVADKSVVTAPGMPADFHQFGVYDGNVYDCATGATAGKPNSGDPLATYLANVFPGLALTAAGPRFRITRT